MNVIHIILKEDWEEQIVKQGYGHSITKEEKQSGGNSYKLLLGHGHADCICFHTFHKQNLSRRIGCPVSDGRNNWTFENNHGNEFYLAYQHQSGGGSGQAKRLGATLSGIGLVFKSLSYVEKKASSRTIVLSTSLDRGGAESHQIAADSSKVKIQLTNFTSRWDANSALGTKTITNGELGDLLNAWYEKSHNKPGMASAAVAQDVISLIGSQQ